MKPQPKACTQEAKLCPDGSSVSRTGPTCEFALCPTPVDPTAGWKIYTNSQHGFSFKYPVSASFPNATVVKEQDNKQAGQFQVFIQSSGLDFVLDIQYLRPGYSKNYLGSKFQELQTINTTNWDILINQGYCDAGSCGQPFLIYQTIKENYRYALVFNNTTTKTPLQNQILSTFKFLDQSGPMVNWKKFVNPNVSFTISYPPEFKVTYEAEKNNNDLPHTLLTLQRNKSFDNSHLTTQSVFLVQLIPNLKTPQACYILSDDSSLLTKNKIINGNTFYYSDKPGKAGLGTTYREQELKLFQDIGDRCYEIDFKYSKSSDWNNPSDIELANKDQEEAFNSIDQILSTFKFL